VVFARLPWRRRRDRRPLGLRRDMPRRPQPMRLLKAMGSSLRWVVRRKAMGNSHPWVVRRKALGNSHPWVGLRWVMSSLRWVDLRWATVSSNRWVGRRDRRRWAPLMVRHR